MQADGIAVELPIIGKVALALATKTQKKFLKKNYSAVLLSVGETVLLLTPPLHHYWYTY